MALMNAKTMHQQQTEFNAVLVLLDDGVPQNPERCQVLLTKLQREIPTKILHGNAPQHESEDDLTLLIRDGGH